MRCAKFNSRVAIKDCDSRECVHFDLWLRALGSQIEKCLPALRYFGPSSGALDSKMGRYMGEGQHVCMYVYMYMYIYMYVFMYNMHICIHT